MGYKLKGNWKFGLAFDLHTLNSEYLGQDEYGHDKYDTTRSEMGELIFQLKYRHDSSIINKIIDLLQTREKLNNIRSMDFIIPVPPSNKDREIQPVVEITRALSSRLGVPFLEDILEKSGEIIELKSIGDGNDRLAILRKQMKIKNRVDLKNKSVLLVDDLYRSGATLTVATDLLYQQCNAQQVSVLTMTKTRTKK